MKLKDPEMFTPGWWARNARLDVHENAMCQKDSVNVSFKVTKNAKGELVIANHSDLEIRHSGDNDPDWRTKISGLFGVRVGLASEFAGHLFCPTTGKKISVSRINGNPPLWIDLENKTAMRCRGLKYETADGPPKAGAGKIDYTFLNPKKVKVFMARLMPILREAKLRCALLELTPEFNRGLMLTLLRNIYEGKLTTASAVYQEAVCVLAWGAGYVAGDKEFRDFINDLCADHYMSSYLEYRA